MKQSGGAESGLVLFLNLGIFDENVDLDHCFSQLREKRKDNYNNNVCNATIMWY